MQHTETKDYQVSVVSVKVTGLNADGAAAVNILKNYNRFSAQRAEGIKDMIESLNLDNDGMLKLNHHLKKITDSRLKLEIKKGAIDSEFLKEMLKMTNEELDDFIQKTEKLPPQYIDLRLLKIKEVMANPEKEFTTKDLGDAKPEDIKLIKEILAVLPQDSRVKAISWFDIQVWMNSEYWKTPEQVLRNLPKYGLGVS